MANVDEENVYRGLGRANHILSRSNEFDDTMIQLSTSPPVVWLVPD